MSSTLSTLKVVSKNEGRHECQYSRGATERHKIANVAWLAMLPALANELVFSGHDRKVGTWTPFVEDEERCRCFLHRTA